MRIPLLVLWLIVCNAIYGQYYNPYLNHYTQKDFGDSCHLQNVSITQTPDGLMYFGNNLRVLEFDGVKWNSVRTPVKGGFVTSLTTGNDSLVYLGAESEFGYLKYDNKNNLKYHSLSMYLEEKDKGFGRIWSVISMEDQIAFLAEKQIFIYKQGNIQSIRPKHSFHTAFAVNNTLYVRQREIGLMKLNNGQLVKVKNSEIFRNYGIFAILPTNNDYHLIVTQELGLFKFFPERTTNNIIAVKTKDTRILKKAKIFGGIRLQDGKFALNTESDGLIIIDDKGNIIYHFNIYSGLPDNSVRAVYQDNFNDIWLATNLGIVKLGYSSPISFYGLQNGIEGRIKDVIQHNNKVYVASSTGLYSSKISKEPLSEKFKKAKNYPGEINQLIKAENEIVAGTNNGLYYVVNNDLELIDDINASAIFYSIKRKNLYTIGTDGFGIYEKKGRWKQKYFITEYALNDALSLIEVENKPYPTVWIGSLNTGLNSIEINEMEEFPFDFYTSFDSVGLDDSWIIPFILDEKAYFSQTRGLKIFNQNENDEFAGFFEDINYFNYKNATITKLFETKENIWLCLNGKLAYYNRNKREIHKKPFNSIVNNKINAIFVKDSNIWVGSDNLLLRYDFEYEKNYQKKPNLLLRNIIVDSIFYPLNPKNKLFSHSENQNQLSIEFASLYEENGNSALYSYILMNYDDKWSAWSNDAKAVYKKLSPGNYKFIVKAKDVYGNESETISILISIQPNWYNSRLAHVVYFILAILLIRFIIYLYTAKLKRDKKRLEAIVKKRTSEIQEQHDVLEQQKQQIEFIHNEQSASIEYAKKIQNSVLPRDTLFKRYFSGHFAFFRPKDIVSGDFYWIGRHQSKLVVCVADCTGHGVPGAFMSMLGISYLVEIVEKEGITSAADILNELRNEIIKALKQKGDPEEAKDGMDIALISIDLKTKEAEFAGAYNPIYIVKPKNGINNNENTSLLESEKNSLQEIKAQRMPIAIYDKMKDFESKTISLQTGDIIYLFSDGFPDQFGGANGGKYKYKPFKNFLLNLSTTSIAEQEEKVTQEFYSWKGDLQQLDDVTIIGLQI